MEEDQTDIYLLNTNTVIQGSKKFAMRGKGNECDRSDATEDKSPEIRPDDWIYCKE